MSLTNTLIAQSTQKAAKSISRLSSDTDNETDRLLGSQRNEQLKKMANNEIAANTTSGLDNQTNNISNNNNFSNKFASNSREGKCLLSKLLLSYYSNSSIYI